MATMLEPDTIRQFILPLHKKVIDIVHNKNKKFLLHCCGNIKEIMPDILQNGIDAKHSNEDQICLLMNGSITIRIKSACSEDSI